jgi:hypothetical protein
MFDEYTTTVIKNEQYRSYVVLIKLHVVVVVAGKPAYTLIGTYELPSSGLQKLMEIGTIIGDKAYSVQYIADAPRYADYLPIVQKMISSLVIKNTLSDHGEN